MSFNGQYNQQVAQEYTYDNNGQYVQTNPGASRQMSASSTTSGASNGAESNSAQLYMGDLDPNWTENDIKQIWASLGEPNVHVKLIKNSGSLCNSGYCFVEFPSNLAATNALLKMGLSIPLDPSRSLKLNWASFATAPGTEFSIFVGDLAPNVTESQLFELFISRYASTLNAKIVFDQTTGVSKGYGFVKFGNESEQQDSLVEMQGVFLNGRAIRVSTTSKNKSRFQTAGSGPAASGAGVGATGVGSSSNSGHMQSVGNQGLLQQSQFIYPVQQQPSLSQFTDPNNTTVFIGGLSSLVTEEQLRAYFQPFGQIVYVKIPIGKGCGFVQYVDRSSAENAIAKMQGFPIGNSRIRLSWGRSAKQAAAMQQAFAVALQHLPQQQAQAYRHSQQHQLQQQSSQPNQKQVSPSPQGAPQPLLQQQLQQQFPYQQHPALPQTYSFPIDSLNGTGSSYTPVSHPQSLHMNYQTTGLSDIANSSALLPNRSNLDFSGFSSATSNTSSFNFIPPASLGVGLPHQSFDYSPGATPLTQTSGTAVSGQFTTHPHILVQGGEAYVKGRNSSLDRLEQGSNGYIFV